MQIQRFTLLACLLVPAVSAAEISASDTIVVTATRTETPISDAIVPITVITREDIELSGATDLAELLRFQAGIDIGRNGGPGTATSVFMRGTESNHTLILIDGVRMNPGTIGGGAIQNISPEVIERVEIVKGARSALYGTDAIGGVINIITRRADDTEFQAGLGGGKFDSRSAFVSTGHRGDNGEARITIDWADTDGFSPSTALDIDRGYDNLSVSLFGSRDFGDATVSLRHWNASGNVEYFSFFGTPLDQDFRNATTAVEWEQRVSEAGSSNFILSYMQDEIDQNQAPDFVHSDRVSVDWQYSHALANHTLTAGVFFMDETAASLPSFGDAFDEDTDVRALFVQDQWSRDRHRAFAAVRFSDHSSYGNETTWNLEYAYDISDSLTASIGAGHAFRAPDATDRFGFGGNVNLEPEIADEIQAGLRYRPAPRHSIDVEIYSNDIEDLIGFDETFSAVNIDEAEIRGAQLGYEYTGDTFTFRGEFVRQTADDKSTGERLLRRAEETLTLSYTQSIGEHRLGLSVLASGDREDFATSLPGYVLANLTGQIRLGDTLQLNARVENLLDTDYETAAGFRMQERSAFVELRYNWK